MVILGAEGVSHAIVTGMIPTSSCRNSVVGGSCCAFGIDWGRDAKPDSQSLNPGPDEAED